jgi:hypothetical protein
VSKRSAEEIRQEMALERRRLDESRHALRAELRSLVPIVVLGLVAAGLITARKGVRGGITMIRKLS